MNTSNISDSCSEVLNVLYTHFLTKVPGFNLCDESFCRSYIAFQKWKGIRKVEDWEGMDKIMYKMFKRTPESIANSETLRQILMPASQATFDIVSNLFRSLQDISDAYFKHITAKKNTEMDDLDFNIDLGEDEPTIRVEDDNEEEVTFMKAYYEIERNMSNLTKDTNEPSLAELNLLTTFKEEIDEDDDVQFIGVITAEPQNKENFFFNDSENICGTSNLNTPVTVQEERLSPASTPLLTSTRIEKSSDIEHLNGIMKIPPSAIAETSSSCSTADRPETENSIGPILSSGLAENVLENNFFEISSVSGHVDADNGTNQPKVSLVSNTTQVPSPSTSPIRLNNSDSISKNCSNENSARTVEMKSVEVQAGISNSKNHVYNDYGLTTPPFDVASDETSARSVELCVYTNIRQNPKNVLEKTVCEKSVATTRSVEVQVDQQSKNKNCLYNDYGLTPPNETSIDDHNLRLEGTCLYTNIGQSHKERVIEQDYTSDLRVSETNEIICSQKDEQREKLPQVSVRGPETIDAENCETSSEINVKLNCDILPNTTKKNTCTVLVQCVDEISKADLSQALVIEQDTEYDDFDNHIDISQINIDGGSDTEEIDIESCQETENDIPLVEENSNIPICEVNEVVASLEVDPLTKDSCSSFQLNDQIDTGQKTILNTAPNINSEPENGVANLPSGDQHEENLPGTKDLSPVSETFNGNSILKPLVSSNRTNGQTKDIDNNPPKIMYTSTQKLKASLDDFSKFESSIQLQWSKMKENHDLEKVFTGPVTKITPTKHNSLLSSQDRMDIFGGISQESNSKPISTTNSRSNSPTEMTSPAYEGIDDFRNYFSDRVNGRVPPPHDVPVPQGILKKSNSTRKKNYRIMFHESTCDNSEERRPRSDGVLVPKRVRRDKKLNMEPRVVVERLSFIENKMKKVLNNPPTLRVDYDKTTRHINEKDVVRCISPPRFSWMIKSYDFSRSRHNSGSLTVKNREHLEKKPKKRKLEPQSNSIGEPAATRKRAFRTSEKKPLGVKEVSRKRRTPSRTENSFVSKGDSEFDKLLNSGSYSNKPFRLDLTS